MLKKRASSFVYAFQGIVTALKDEPNMKIHFLAASVVISVGWILHISSSDWKIILLTIGFVLSIELINTAFEEIVDSFTDRTHPAARKAKDVAAGAVFIAAFFAIIIALFVFLPYLSF